MHVRLIKLHMHSISFPKVIDQDVNSAGNLKEMKHFFAYLFPMCLKNRSFFISLCLSSFFFFFFFLLNCLNFQAIGHGISSSFLDKVRGVAKQFFALPVEEKEKYSRAVNESEGYGSDRIVSEKQVLEWSYRLTLRVFPEDQRRLNLWPKNPNDFGYLLNILMICRKFRLPLLIFYYFYNHTHKF
jgi:hypothetical protein